MRIAPRLSISATRLPTRGTAIAIVAMPSLAAAVLTWRGTVLGAIIPLVVVFACAALFILARRSLRRASRQIDTILREELAPARQPRDTTDHRSA